MQTGSGKGLAFLTISLMLTACGGGGGGTAATPDPIPITTTPFTTWRTDLASKTFQLDGQGNQVSGRVDANSHFYSVEGAEAATASAVFMFDTSSNLSGLSLTSTTSTASKTEGFAGTQITTAADPDFLSVKSTASEAIISDPKSPGWDYQSFGVWETGLDTLENRTLHAISLGTPTAGTAIPGSGTATFSGKVVGSYVSAGGLGHTVLADLSVAADFGNQSLVFNTTNTRISADGLTYTGTSSLDLSGSLGYGIGNNSISGSLTTTGGTPLTGNSTGQFYGPAAEELGGVFSLKNPSTPLETYSGAYGAKR